MNKSRAMLFSAVLLTVAMGGTAMAGSSVSFMAGAGTGTQSAVFASFLADIPDVGINTAISVSNILAAPDGLMYTVQGGAGEGTETEGTLEIYLYRSDGKMVMWETDGTVGFGTDMNGELEPGQTYTVFLRQILDAAEMTGPFVGYGWIVANFDGVAGTRTVTSLGDFNFFAHSEMSPGVDHNGGGLKPMMMDMDMDME